MSANHCIPGATRSSRAKPISPARLISHMAAQPQKPITSQLIRRSLRWVSEAHWIDLAVAAVFGEMRHQC